MKIMLTSTGITNPTLENALRDLVGSELKIAFIPTAANTVGIGKEDKTFLIKNYNECLQLGFTDIVDISGLDKKVWLSRLQKANVIFFGGGDVINLITWIKKSGLVDELPELLNERVYVGISAGSHVASKDLAASSNFLFSENEVEPDKGLGLVDFYTRAHLNAPKFPDIIDENLKKYVGKLDQDCYALDDDSALVYVNGKIDIVSEGKWIKYPA